MTQDQAPPDPMETVTILRSDFELLQKAVDFAVEDTKALAIVLGMDFDAAVADGVTPREIMLEALLPRVAQLVHTQMQVNAAGEEIRQRAARFGNQTKDFGNGVKGLKVGQKIPGLFDGPSGG